jgi:hypothetical protein
MFFSQSPNTTATRDRAIFWIANHTLLRGDNVRMASLADLQLRDIADQKGARIPTVQLIMRSGKTNKANRVEKVGAVRSRHPEQCSFGALAFHLFTRFHITDEPFPNVLNNRDW